MEEIFIIIEKDYTGFITLDLFRTSDAAKKWCANKVWDEYGHDDNEEAVKQDVYDSLEKSGEYTDESNNHYTIISGKSLLIRNNNL